mgnify:CR=1 FL=1
MVDNEELYTDFIKIASLDEEVNVEELLINNRKKVMEKIVKS